MVERSTNDPAVAASAATAVVAITWGTRPAWASYGQMQLGGLIAALLLLALLLLLAWVVLALWCRWFRHRLLAWPTSLAAGLWWGMLLGQRSDLQALLRWTPDLLALGVLLGIAASGLFVLLAPALQAHRAAAGDPPDPTVGPPIEAGAVDRSFDAPTPENTKGTSRQ